MAPPGDRDVAEWVEGHPDFVAARERLRMADQALARALRNLERVKYRLTGEYASRPTDLPESRPTDFPSSGKTLGPPPMRSGGEDASTLLVDHDR